MAGSLLILLQAASVVGLAHARAKPSPRAHGLDSLNADLSYKHAQTNLAHLRVLPRAGETRESNRIHYSHNISRADGSQDLVHYNVSHVVGVVSLDVSPRLNLSVEICRLNRGSRC